MFGLGVQELIVIFLIVMVLFGAKKLPEIGKRMGKGVPIQTRHGSRRG